MATSHKTQCACAKSELAVQGSQFGCLNFASTLQPKSQTPEVQTTRYATAESYCNYQVDREGAGSLDPTESSRIAGEGTQRLVNKAL
ncbi:hypothetical protein E2C01_021962 [Portunus trituberculatus]|uniref:Uncharacterized protein n=1 Tax=Portunus trituberculatus TaxID=210409 RepID=A0A5B7E3Z6_PORTR|nr:hypothetical protein [Portunus trituberculatus]